MKNETIIISMAKDRVFTEKLEKLHLIVPTALIDEEGSVKTNPFMDYILEKDSIRRDLYEFLYGSDFLQLLDQNVIEYCKELYDRNAPIEWYHMLLTVFEDKPDKEEFCKSIIDAFRKNISIKDTLVMFETNNTAMEMDKNIEIYLQVKRGDKGENIGANESARYEIEKYEQIIEQLKSKGEIHKQKIADLEEEKEKLTERNTEYFAQIENANKTVLEIKKEILMYRSDREKIINYRNENRKILKTTRDTLERYTDRIHSLENTVLNVKEELSEANTSLEEQRVHIDELNDMVENLRSEKERYFTLSEQYHQQLIELASKGFEESENDYEDADSEEIYEAATLDDNLLRLDEVEVVDNGEATQSEDDEIESLLNDVKEEKTDYGYEDVRELEDNTEVFNKKTNIFVDFMLKHSEKYFNKRPRQEQENLIKIKMMDMLFSLGKVKIVKENLNDTIPYYDLYKFICKDPSEEELKDFFNDFGLGAVTD